MVTRGGGGGGGGGGGRGGGGHDYHHHHHHHHVPPKFLQIKQEDKFFSRLLSKETSTKEASFRVLYYGGAAGAIPFMWESRPGTPKHTLSDTSLPPLTPPPSYQMSPSILTSHNKHNNKPVPLMPKFLKFLRMPRKEKSPFGTTTTTTTTNNTAAADFASFSSSSFSSSYSTPSSTTLMSSCTTKRNNKSRVPLSSSVSDHPVHFGFGDDEDEIDREQTAISSPTSTLCFRSGSGSRSKYGIKNMKKTVLSIVGHGATAQKCR